MLDLDAATKVIEEAIPNGTIQQSIVYNGLYIFEVFTDDPEEGQYDPFYSVDQHTGEVKEFSIISDGDPAEVSALFTKNGDST